MAIARSQEGLIDCAPPGAGKPCKIWYTVYSDLSSSKRPLLVIHGGPGLNHDYMLSMADLASPPHNIPVIFYDQLGCGQSTHMREKLRDSSFWTEKLYLDELTTVLFHLGIQDDYDILGHSWGGMLASTHAARQPLGLKRLILSGVPVSTSAWINTFRLYRDQMPAQHREVLKLPRDFDTKDTPEYEEAIAVFYKRHYMSLDRLPDEYIRSYEIMKRDPTVALSTLGPSEFESLGFLSTWNITDELHKIDVQTLLINGVNEGADDRSMRIMEAGIKDVNWVKFEGSVHMAHWEERKRHMEVVFQFLDKNNS